MTSLRSKNSLYGVIKLPKHLIESQCRSKFFTLAKPYLFSFEWNKKNGFSEKLNHLKPWKHSDIYHKISGVISTDGKYYLWKVNYSGIQVFFNTIESLLNQVVQGAKNISNDTLETVIDILELLEHLMRKCRSRMSNSQISTLRKLCLLLVDKFVHVPNPPVYLLAGNSALKCAGNG